MTSPRIPRLRIPSAAPKFLPGGFVVAGQPQVPQSPGLKALEWMHKFESADLNQDRYRLQQQRYRTQIEQNRLTGERDARDAALRQKKYDLDVLKSTATTIQQKKAAALAQKKYDETVAENKKRESRAEKARKLQDRSLNLRDREAKLKELAAPFNRKYTKAMTDKLNKIPGADPVGEFIRDVNLNKKIASLPPHYQKSVADRIEGNPKLSHLANSRIVRKVADEALAESAREAAEKKKKGEPVPEKMRLSKLAHDAGIIRANLTPGKWEGMEDAERKRVLKALGDGRSKTLEEATVKWRREYEPELATSSVLDALG